MGASRALTIALFVMGVGLMLTPGDPSKASIVVIQWSPRVDRLLEPHRATLGADFAPYRAHVFRSLSYATEVLGGAVAARPVNRALEVALVYQHLGLWTDRTLRYLDASAAQLRAALERDGAVAAEGLSERERALAEACVRGSLKLTPARGAGPDAAVINAVRVAEWLENSGGWVGALTVGRNNAARVRAALRGDAEWARAKLAVGRRLHGDDWVAIARGWASNVAW